MAGGMSPRSRKRCRNPKPSRPGIFKSVRITSAAKWLSFSSASLPSAAVSGVIPQAETMAARPERWLDSSSTMRTFRRWVKEKFLPGSEPSNSSYAASGPWRGRRGGTPVHARFSLAAWPGLVARGSVAEVFLQAQPPGAAQAGQAVFDCGNKWGGAPAGQHLGLDFGFHDI